AARHGGRGGVGGGGGREGGRGGPPGRPPRPRRVQLEQAAPLGADLGRPGVGAVQGEQAVDGGLVGAGAALDQLGHGHRGRHRAAGRLPQEDERGGGGQGGGGGQPAQQLGAAGAAQGGAAGQRRQQEGHEHQPHRAP